MCGEGYHFDSNCRVICLDLDPPETGRNAPVLRWFVQPSHEDGLPLADNPFCSAAVSAALRAGGWDPVKNLADQDTTPGDLERADLTYLFTLTPDEEALTQKAGSN